MKNKIVIFFIITILSVCFFFSRPASASGWVNIQSVINQGTYAFWVYQGTTQYLCNTASNPVSGNRIYTYKMYYKLNVTTFNPGPDNSIGEFFWTYSNTNSYITIGANDIIVFLKGSFSITGNNHTYDSVSDYQDAIAPKWYEVLWDDFKQFVSDLGLELITPFDPNSIIDIADWFENAWTVKVGEGEDDLLNQIDVVTPTPVPPSPTPIPYQTVIVPDGNGGSIIQYKYLNPSGTPIITDQPPQQNVTVNNDDDNGFEYPYYENPDNKDNPFKFKIPWYLKLVLRHNDIDIDTLDDHYQVAQNQVQSEDVVNAVNEVYNGFQVLPTDWLLLLGAIASIPLFAALIHRFLQG